MKVSWAREGGATREQQLANRPQDQWLIDTVYLKRGSALDIRASVEADCMADKERQAASLAAAAARIQGSGMAPTPSAQGPAESELARMRERQDAEIEANQAAFKQSRCADLSRQYESLARQENAGGSSATMQRLNEQRRGLNERKRNEGC